MSKDPASVHRSVEAVEKPVAKLRKGDRIHTMILLVEVANFKQTRDGKYFIQMVLRDRTGSVRAVRWEASHELYASFSTSDFIRVSGRVEEFQQNLQVVVDGLERVPAQDVNFEDFLPMASRKLEDMEKELLEHVVAMSDPHLRDLLSAVLEDDRVRRDLLRSPAGKTLHHAYIGGLIDHILSLIGAAKLIARNYPRLNVDLLVAAAVLHDIGKVRELFYGGGFGYTDEGQLVGHIGIGLVLVTEKAKQLRDFPEEYLVHLQHIIASHHGLPEHGALKLPMTPESIAFHLLDNLDAKMAMLNDMEKELSDVQNGSGGSKWSEYKPALGRRIYFPD